MAVATKAREDGRAAGSEDAVLLREFSHRAGNELAMALAAIRMVAAGGPAVPGARARLVADALGRMEASAELHRLLARPVPVAADAGAWVRSVCEAVAASRGEADSVDMMIDTPAIELDGRAARRLVLIAAEFVANAFRHAVSGGATRLEVSLRRVGRQVRLVVRDDGPGIAPGRTRAGGGLGSGIVAELVRLGGGRVSVATGTEGTAFSVEMPVGRAPGRGPAGVQ